MRRRILLTVMLAVMLTAPALPVLADPGPGVVHTVQPGDTLSNIARRYCTTWQELYQLNAGALANPNQLYAGARLRVIDRCGGGWPGGGPWPGGGLSGGPWTGVVDRGARPHAQGYVQGGAYVVVRGDTAYSIGQRFGVTVAALGQANGINPWLLYPGQRLVIPTLGGYPGTPGCWPQPLDGAGCPPSSVAPPGVMAIPITPVPYP